ncbi:MAG: hypothetical protein K2M07_07250 [Muribaculaceae bacterium]|nr:hypothetical protein [Muribaculaceae bacterium]
MSNRHYFEEEREESRPRKGKTSIWVAIGAVVLIILLILWLTFADLAGDTDVAAFILPAM